MPDLVVLVVLVVRIVVVGLVVFVGAHHVEFIVFMAVVFPFLYLECMFD